ncbi:MBL fold metallo-hydrolase [Bacteroides gallinaceum]|uniref:MBL fold metallo-hydrolase n=1 Tax=Candidatus Phocaeicola excrementipullorum TaxID=2838731 RepID=A0A948X378_9BACT|nr:MBL fold metallo-hydrolase [Bacteroides gallinaceum]MBU3856619.1 MBL fold metallo-hydrolase [Candidatus Phocaeicola excrementipullorum]MDM8206560.1 MBL fold metallo-hydrolase [Bacteroides gallinaceum]
MKKSMILLAGAVMILASACGGSAKKQAADEADSITATVYMGVKTIRLDSVKATWIRDNSHDKLMPVGLFDQNASQLADSLGLKDGIPSSVSTFLVETDGKRILFDTGVGASDSQLQTGLKALGVAPDEVEYLYLTHFHGDHIGGMMKGDTVVFAKAQVYASKAEYDAWMKMDAEKKAQVVKTMEAYKDRLHLFEFGDELPGHVMAIKAAGHTPGHTAYQIGKLLVVGDLMHGAALQTVNPDICASYDMDKQEAVATRRILLDYARKNGLTMAGMHLPMPAFR